MFKEMVLAVPPMSLRDRAGMHLGLLSPSRVRGILDTCPQNERGMGEAFWSI